MQEEIRRPVHGSSSGAGMALVAIVIGLVFIVGPIVAGSLVGGLSKTILIVFGVGLLLVGAVIVVITRLYVKTSANMAFVRTGMGGTKAIIDGGALVIPVVHNMIPVSLETIKLEVERVGKESLICGNRLRADVIARFFLKVAKNQESVVAAATSLGERTLHTPALLLMIGEKLESALRDVAATRTLHDLNTKRDEFATAVQAIVVKELEPNGLTLETVTITKLDQTDTSHLRPDANVFDAEGARTIAEITQAARVARNQIERTADQQVKEQDVARDQFVYAQEVTRATAEADTNAATAKAKAKAEQEAATFQADQTRMAGVARVEAEQAVTLADVARLQRADVAGKIREQAVAVAEVERQRTADLAERQRQIDVAKAEQARATAEAARLDAEKARETSAQGVVTVQATAQAQRESDVAIIAKQADARQRQINENATADIAAYTTVKQAEAAEEAAAKNAAARLRLAEAEKDAKSLEAEGDKAQQLVPVVVSREQTLVDRARLEQQVQFGRAAIDLQIALARIAADREVRIAAANALGTALGQAKMTIWGDPETAKKMTDSFLSGQEFGLYTEGVLNATPDEVKALVAQLGATGIAMLKKVAGVDLSNGATAVDATVVG